jgi:hypothetical protein
MDFPDAKTIAEVLGFLILILLNIGRRMGREEITDVSHHTEQQDERLRLVETRMAAFEVAGVGREKRLDAIGQKMSDIADEQQRWIGQAMDRFVSKGQCDDRMRPWRVNGNGK